MARIYMNPSTANKMRKKTVSEPSWVKSAKEVLASTDTFDPEAGKATDVPFVEEVTDEYDNLTVANLKAILKARDLSLTGNKAELIQRLRLDDANTSDSTEAPVEEAAVEEDTVAPTEEVAATIEENQEGEVSESGGETGGNATE